MYRLIGKFTKIKQFSAQNQILQTYNIFNPTDHQFQNKVNKQSTRIFNLIQKIKQKKIQQNKQQLDGLYKYIIQKIVKGTNKQLNQSANYFFDSPGKMIRPKLIMVLNKFASKSLDYQTKNIKLNQCKLWCGLIQSLHIASLMHDDVIDKSSTRRGKICHHKVYGEKQSLFSGDYLIAKAGQKLIQFDNIKMYQIFSQIIGDLTNGEVLQASKYQPNSVNQIFRKYLLKCYFKTGAMLSHSLRGVFQIHKKTQQQQLLAFTLGVNLGVSFQIIDDIIDFIGDPKITGKPKLLDLSDGIVNCPVFFSLINSKNQTKQFIKQILGKKKPTQNQIQQIQKIVIQSKGIQKSKYLALLFAQRALQLTNRMGLQQQLDGMRYFNWKIIIRQK